MLRPAIDVHADVMNGTGQIDGNPTSLRLIPCGTILQSDWGLDNPIVLCHDAEAATQVPEFNNFNRSSVLENYDVVFLPAHPVQRR